MNKRVLVVEDDALLGLDIAKQLTDAGLEVVARRLRWPRPLD